MTFDPMVPVVGAIAVALVVIALIVLMGIRGPERGRRTRIARRVLIAVALLAIGLRPGIPDLADRTVIASDIDVYIVADTTGSVAAEDFMDGETRLDAMKADIGRIVEGFPGARLSLLTFDSVAIVRVPLTRDGSAIVSAAEVLRPEFTVYSSGSSISEPRDLLRKTLEDAEKAEPQHQRVVFYLGDGEQTASGEPESFAEVADFVQTGAVLGYGTEEGGRMLATTNFSTEPEEGEEPAEPEYIQDYSGSSSGRDALSRIDEENLETIAEELGVAYVHRTDETAIPGLAAMNTPGEVALAEDGRRAVQELYWIPALLAFTLLLWEAGVVVVGLVDGFTAGRRRR